MLNLSSSQLRRAADIKAKIELLQKQLNSLLSDAGSGSPKAHNTSRILMRRMDAAAKAKLSAKMKAIWKARKASQKAK